jgi:hypothetical protein
MLADGWYLQTNPLRDTTHGTSFQPERCSVPDDSDATRLDRMERST